MPELLLYFPLQATAFFLIPLCIRIERTMLIGELQAKIALVRRVAAKQYTMPPSSPLCFILAHHLCIVESQPVDTELFLEACTSSSAHPTKNYERLEHLGDALLKYGVSLHLFLKYQKLHEGQLSVARMQVRCLYSDD